MQAIVNSSQTKAPTRNAARGGLTGALRVSHRRARDRPTDSPTDPGSHGGSRPMTAHGGETKAASKMRGASDGRRGSGPRHRAGQSPRGPCRGPSPSLLAVLVPCSCTEASSAARPSRSSSPREPAASVGPLHPISPWRLLPGRPRLSRTPVGIRKRSRVPGGIAAISGFLQDEQPSGEPCLA